MPRHRGRGSAGEQGVEGERIYIARRGRRVAVLTGIADADTAGEPALADFRALRKRVGRGPESIRELSEEGRR